MRRAPLVAQPVVAELLVVEQAMAERVAEKRLKHGAPQRLLCRRRSRRRGG